MSTMQPSKLYELLLTAETDGDRAADARRVLGAERQRLGLALARVQVAAKAAKDAEAIRYSTERDRAVRTAKRDHSEALHHMLAVAAEAQRVAEMWEGR